MQPDNEIWHITREILFLKNHAGKKAGILVSDLYMFFRKALYEVKAGSMDVSFNIFQ